MSASLPTIAPKDQFYELYRKSSVGMALLESLDSLIQQGHMSPQLALKVLAQFDKSASTTLGNKVQARATAKAHLKTYRLCDEVWTFILEKAVFKIDGDTLGPVDKIKIVACKSSSNVDPSAEKK